MKQLAHLGAAAVLAFAGLHAAAAESVPAGIQSQLKQMEKTWANQEIDALHAGFTADAMVSGEGMPAPVRDSAALRQLLAGMTADAKSVKLVVDRSKLLGPASALTWLTWIVTPRAEGAAEFRMQSLTVWNKTADGWKITADMFAHGDLTKK